MDFYDKLGIPPKATAAEIRRAYRRCARMLHPALNPGDKIAASRFEAIAQAFEVLSDPERRAAYDRGDVIASGSDDTSRIGFEGFDFSAEAIQESVGFKEIFGSTLDRFAVENTVGEDLQLTARVGLDEIFSGTKRRVHLVRLDHCPVCAGAGVVARDGIACKSCQGAGIIKARRGHMVFARACPDCSGSGVIAFRRCDRCRGDGRLTQSEWLDVEIPKGVRDGSQLRIPGAGNAGSRGGASGDLILTIEVEPHEFYRWEGEDLVCTVPVTIVEAAIGGHIEVPTPDGPVTIELPTGTQAGQRFRLRGRGAPRIGKKSRADLYVVIQVVVPTISDDHSRELLRQVAERNPMNPRGALVNAAIAPSEAGVDRTRERRE
ncbi:MAG: J domain-containing protein [Vicinamibacteria bacterium]|nr:J domain-containing protein [Vicinamibacteria bacterium]